MSEELIHIGMPRRSGRYPWGSGEDPYQSSKSWMGSVQDLRSQGMSDTLIAKGMGLNTSEFRNQLSLARRELRAGNVTQALRLQERGHSLSEIGRRMGVNESTVRSWFDPATQEREMISRATVNMLKDQIKEKGYLDVGIGVENHMGISRTKLKNALYELEAEGYNIHYPQTTQLGTGKKTTMMTLAPPGDPKEQYKEIAQDPSKIGSISDRSEDGGRSWQGLRPVESISSDRVMVRYYEDGGADKDGVIELRRGVDGLNLGEAQYAQVRIGVDGTHFMKGMAIYADKMPDGVDIIYNSNKSKDEYAKMQVFKKMADDPNNPGVPDQENPFREGKKSIGATIGAQRGMLNILGTEDKLSEEGAWDKWSNTISSQMLSKQPPGLAKKQLDLAAAIKKDEFDDIMALTNPEVKKHLLQEFADGCDSAAVHLKAAGMPRQAWKVILPITDMKENEVYAPTFKNGEQVVLIRHPHGGIFEIPQLTVNNKSESAQRIMKNAADAVGINPKVAQKLSGADFDGDTVLVIPNPEGRIKTSPSLKGLADFEPRILYKNVEGAKKLEGVALQREMGVVSNLITDMTVKGAPPDEIARAVRYSMVVIDAEKHNLNHKRAAELEGISSLKAKYQEGGASTLISRASSEERIPQRKEGARVGPVSKLTGERTVLYTDPKTGEKLYRPTGETYVKTTVNKRTGAVKEEVITKMEISTKMRETKDARTLSSGTPIETVYASYANQMKALGNQARLAELNVKSRPYSPSARIAYATEVASLNAALKIAKRAAPLERDAQRIARSVVTKTQQANPDLDRASVKKLGNRVLAEARTRLGSRKEKITISPREWEAIQAGAISNSMLNQILKNTDSKQVKQLATPRVQIGMASSKIARAKLMLSSGSTQAEVAAALGVSTSTLAQALG